MIFRRAFLALFSTTLLLGLAWGCAAADDSGNAVLASGGSNSLVDSGNEGSVIVTGAGRQNTGPLGLNPLCDSLADSSCVPDSSASCAQFTPPAVPSEDAGPGLDAAGNGQAGANGAGGSGGDSAGPIDSSRAGDGGDGGAAGVAGATGVAGDGNDGGAVGSVAGAAGAAGAPAVVAPEYSCQVQRVPSSPYAAFSGCALAGPGAENAPCLTSNDCQAGLGCVGDQNAGLCLKYCCQDANDCAQGTYCAERPMRDATTNGLPKGNSDTSTALLIPVCVHAENCDLSAPYPCPKGSDCACKSDTACLVVRADGTTTCAVPGTGTAGKACPCAWGHVCSAATSQCLKLCYTRDSGSCGDDGRCQSAAELPDGWGVCIGAPPEGG